LFLRARRRRFLRITLARAAFLAVFTAARTDLRLAALDVPAFLACRLAIRLATRLARITDALFLATRAALLTVILLLLADAPEAFAAFRAVRFAFMAIAINLVIIILRRIAFFSFLVVADFNLFLSIMIFLRIFRIIIIMFLLRLLPPLPEELLPLTLGLVLVPPFEELLPLSLGLVLVPPFEEPPPPEELLPLALSLGLVLVPPELPLPAAAIIIIIDVLLLEVFPELEDLLVEVFPELFELELELPTLLIVMVFLFTLPFFATPRIPRVFSSAADIVQYKYYT